MNDSTVLILESMDRIEGIAEKVSRMSEEQKNQGRIDDYVVTLLNAAKLLIGEYLLDHDTHKAELARDLSLFALAHIKGAGIHD